MTDLQTARFVTRHYNSLQGLVLVPLGAFLVLLVVGQLLGWPGFRQGDCTISAILLPIAIALTFVALAYYRRRFGEVQRRPSKKEYVFLYLSFGGWWLLAFIDMAWLDKIPVSFSMLGLALFFALIPLSSGGRRRYYYLLAALPIGFAFFPLLGIIPKLDLFSGRWLGNLVIGSMLVIGGLLDHWTLVRALTPPKETQP